MPVTLMWGERGLVATLFMDLSAVADCARWIAFLQQIQFVNPGPHIDWKKVQRVWAVVEPGFGNRGFGSPDAVFRLEFADNRHVVVLLEAKLCGYLEACWLPAARGQKGFNSRLNGQLELNHRLTLALAAYQPANHQLIEPEWVPTRYAATYPAGFRRRVNDPSVRQRLMEPLINADSYLHVIVTSDNINPMTVDANTPLLPEIFIDAQDGNQWNNERYRFGWTNWSGLQYLAVNWHDPPARFPENLAFNLPNVFGAGAGGRHDELPAAAGQVLPPDWPPGRPAKGVSLIFAPGINPGTFLHFSWLRNSCRLRDYIPDPPPAPDDTRTTMEVLGLIMHEEPCGARRPRTEQVEQWRVIIQDVNRRYGLGN